MKSGPLSSVLGLSEALCAISFFRQRHGRTVRGKRNIPCHNLNLAADNRRLCRSYIRAARAAGFRGSIVAALGVKSTRPAWAL